MDAAQVANTNAGSLSILDERTPRPRPAREDGAPMTSEEFASRLRISTRTLRKLVVAGMPHLRVGRKVRFDAATAKAWLATRRAAAPPRIVRAA